MHASLFDRYQAAESPLHRLDPRVKVVITLAFILSNVLLPDGAWVAFGLAWGLLLVASAASGLGVAYPLKRSVVALPFVLAAFSAIFALPGRTLTVWEVGPWQLVATDAGLVRFLSIVVRSWLSVQAAILLVAVTQFPDLMHALRHLRMPGVLVAVISFMYRYLFVLSDETVRLLRAREARSAAAFSTPGTNEAGKKRLRAGGSVLWRARVAGSMAGQLFLRSYERSERVYDAMLARGFQGQLYTLNPHEMRNRDWIVAVAVLLALGALQVLARF